MDSISTQTLLDEFLDFVLSHPTLEQIVAYRVSERLDQHMQYLMDQNNQGTLSAAECDALDEFVRITRFMRRLKIHARQRWIAQ